MIALTYSKMSYNWYLEKVRKEREQEALEAEKKRKLEEEKEKQEAEKAAQEKAQKLKDDNVVNYAETVNKQEGLFDRPDTTSNDMTSQNNWSSAKERGQNFRNTNREERIAQPFGKDWYGSGTEDNVQKYGDRKYQPGGGYYDNKPNNSRENTTNRQMGEDWYGSVTAENHKKYGDYTSWQDYYSDPKNQPKNDVNSQEINQGADVDNRMQNNFYDNTFGAGASVGNNNSVNIISQGGQGLNNMQSTAAYKALNNNDYERSYARLNGYGRSAGAIEEAEKSTGVRNRVSNLYNMSGLTQKYWNNKSLAHQADYLGDIWKEGGFKYQMPGTPSKPEDKTQEIADGMDLDKD